MGSVRSVKTGLRYESRETEGKYKGKERKGKEILTGVFKYLGKRRSSSTFKTSLRTRQGRILWNSDDDKAPLTTVWRETKETCTFAKRVSHIDEPVVVVISPRGCIYSLHLPATEMMGQFDAAICPLLSFYYRLIRYRV